MDYQKHYNLLILTRRERTKCKNIYYEKHHILPKSMGGTDDEMNLIDLTAREHFIAHWLLWRIHRNRQTAYAFHCMTRWKNSKIQGSERTFSSRGYAEAREAYIQMLSISMSGRKRPFKKRSPLSEETKQKISDIKTGKRLGTISESRSMKLIAYYESARLESLKKQECESCHTEFEYDSRSRNPRFCSKKCASSLSSKRKKTVEVINLRTNEMTVYDSITQAAKALQINRSEIYSHKENMNYKFIIHNDRH